VQSVIELQRSLRERFGTYRYKRKRDRVPLNERYPQELRREVNFWRRFISSGGSEWPQAFERQTSPEARVKDGVLMAKIDLVKSEPVEILDVGAGPLTIIGTTYPGRTLEITATDPLADDYDRLLAEAGVEPPIRTLQCRGEDLLERFGPERFDIAFARNAIDHTIDPVCVIQNMLAVVKPAGFVVLRHYRNEGVTQSYDGLHLWNFDVDDGRLILWNRKVRHDLSALFAPDAEIEVDVHGGGDHEPWITAAMRKRESPPVGGAAPARERTSGLAQGGSLP
jgi:SAM-dependent methyltransferase